MDKKCAFCDSRALLLFHTDGIFVKFTKAPGEPVATTKKVQAEVCAFCNDNVPSLNDISRADREVWKAAASVANYLEARLKR